MDAWAAAARERGVRLSAVKSVRADVVLLRDVDADGGESIESRSKSRVKRVIVP